MEINREILYEFAKNIVQEYESTKSDGEIFT